MPVDKVASGASTKEGMVSSLSLQMLDVLMSHIDGARIPIMKEVKNTTLTGLARLRAIHRIKTYEALLKRGLIRPQQRALRPRYTEITAAGRLAVAEGMAYRAEELIMAKTAQEDAAELALSPDFLAFREHLLPDILAAERSPTP